MSDQERRSQAAERPPKRERPSRVVIERPSFAGKIVTLKEQHPDLYKEFHQHLDAGWDIGKLSSWVKACSGISLSEFEITLYADARSRGVRYLGKVMKGEKREEIDGPQNDRRDPGSLRETIQAELRKKVAEMLDEARRDPTSDANKMIEILLVDQIANEDVRLNDAKALLKEQQQRNQLEKDNKIQDAKLKNQERMLEIRKKQIAATTKAVKTARRALKEGRPIDQLEMVEQISRAIGLSGPPERRVEQ